MVFRALIISVLTLVYFGFATMLAREIEGKMYIYLLMYLAFLIPYTIVAAIIAKQACYLPPEEAENFTREQLERHNYVRKLSFIENAVDRIDDYLRGGRVLVLIVVVYFLGLLLDPMNPFQAMFGAFVEGDWYGRPAYLGINAAMLFFIFKIMILFVQSSVDSVARIITARLSYKEYQRFLNPYVN